jgi:cell wall-associated NlpC family hydrolase
LDRHHGKNIDWEAKADSIIETGLKYLGISYVFGASSGRHDQFDCSSFAQFVYEKNGILLPRNSRQQFTVGTPIPFTKIRKGDLLFFTTKSRQKKQGIEQIGHVAIYLGENKILHTYRQGKKVSITPLNHYWIRNYKGTKRVL